MSALCLRLLIQFSAHWQGLAALLVQGLSGSTLEEVASLSPDWIGEMGLQQSLTPSRNNGFLNMFALMRQKAAELSHAQQVSLQLVLQLHIDAHVLSLQQLQVKTSIAIASKSFLCYYKFSRNPQLKYLLQGKSEPASVGPSSEEVATSATNGSDAGNQSGSAPDGSGKPVRASMERKLTEVLQPEALTILDESAQHAGHAGSRMLASPSGETHFKVSIVSSAFEGLNTVKRHRQVYEVGSLAGSW